MRWGICIYHWHWCRRLIWCVRNYQFWCRARHHNRKRNYNHHNYNNHYYYNHHNYNNHYYYNHNHNHHHNNYHNYNNNYHYHYNNDHNNHNYHNYNYNHDNYNNNNNHNNYHNNNYYYHHYNRNYHIPYHNIWELSGDSYFAFANDYGDTEKFSDIMDPAINRHQSVEVNYENRRRYSIHFHSGSSAGKGYVLKFSVTP